MSPNTKKKLAFTKEMMIDWARKSGAKVVDSEVESVIKNVPGLEEARAGFCDD